MRIPILYYVYRKETLFWRLGVRGGGEDSNCSQLRQSLIVPTHQQQDDRQFDDGTIASLQKVLLENRRITVDFFALDLLEKIGEGATAEVYKGKLERRFENPIDVAIKLYTPQTIDSTLIREFAAEIRLMRSMKHKNISEVIAMSVMPPSVAVILPLYKYGSLNDLLYTQMKSVASHFQRKIELDRPSITNDVQRRLWTTLSQIREHPDSENVATAMFPDRGRVAKIRRRTKNEDTNTPASQSVARAMYPLRGHVQQRRRWSDLERGACDEEEKQNSSPKLHRLKSTSDDWDWDLTTKMRDSNDDDDDDDDSENEFLMNSERIEQVRKGSSMLTWKERLGLCIQLCSGVSYLHRQVPIILHRDLKPHNVLLSKDFCIKICDFGESRVFSRKNNAGRRLNLCRSFLPSCIEKKVLKSERDELELLSDVELPLTIRGSPLWCAPEVLVGLHGVSQYGVRADVYSLTIMIWQILTLEPLYEGMSLFDVMERVVHHNVRPRVPMTWSSNLRDSMKSGWNAVSRNRCTARDLMDALLLEYNKERKISSVA